jgi:mono/diheme cytochrome c family protein
MSRNESTFRLFEEATMIKRLLGALLGALSGALLFCTAAAQTPDESQIQLKPGPGNDLVRSNCAICHSLDYIQMNSPFLDRKGWEGEVNKMVNTMHAPIDKNNIPAIVDYLAKYYGAPSAPAPAASTPTK